MIREYYLYMGTNYVALQSNTNVTPVGNPTQFEWDLLRGEPDREPLTV